MPDQRTTVRVQLAERAYDIEIGTGILADAGQRVAAWTRATHAVVITDDQVLPILAAAVAESLDRAGIRADTLTVPPGETSKSVAVAESLWLRLAQLSADRKTVVVALGGGVVGDLAGFVAATYARGLRLVQVPTSLLAQVDSSVGGKVGINLPQAKNMVGHFWQPRGVLIDTQVLDSLPPREYRSGLAEVVKYGVILDADFFEYLEAHVPHLMQRDAAVLRHAVARCCRLKADVVEADEREETGLRAVLNYGHTFGHALEAVAGYGQLLHGEAVSIGMLCASRLAAALGRIEPALTDRQQRLLTALGLPVELPELPEDDLLRAMRGDKKVEHGRLRFVLPDRLGHVELVGDVAPELVRAALRG
ncbi:MAG: 3-dehydroquinate synthase [Pirellulaceae bacterium]|nr:3-dehydroquinate synthase [Pirellulaceae bacterium]